MHTSLVSRIALKHIATLPQNQTQLPVVAIAEWTARPRTRQEEHNVFIRPDPYNRGNGPVVVIADTGGHWYADDFLKGSGRLAIDYGSNYWLINADEVRAAVKKFLANTTPEVPVDPDELLQATREFTRAWVQQMGMRQLRPKLRFVLEAVAPFVTNLFGERDGEAFTAALGKLRSVEASTKEAGGSDVMDYILPQRDMLKLIDEMADAGDEQSARLATDAYMEIKKKLRLTDNEEQALNRLMGSVQRVGSWDAATQRNNIFKVANLLGIRLPNHIFASNHVAAFSATLSIPVQLHLTHAFLYPSDTGQLGEASDEDHKWGVRGKFGLIGLSTDLYDFSTTMYQSYGRGRLYLTLWSAETDPTAAIWLKAALDLYLEKHSPEVLAQLEDLHEKNRQRFR